MSAGQATPLAIPALSRRREGSIQSSKGERIMKTYRIFAVIITSASFSSVTPAHAAIDYHFHDLGTLGGRNSGAFAINDAGQVAGYSETLRGGSATFYATRWDARGPANLGNIIGGYYSAARAINNAGIVGGGSPNRGGFSEPSGYYSDATLWRGARATELRMPGGRHGWVGGVNSAGRAVGWGTSRPPGPGGNWKDETLAGLRASGANWTTDDGSTHAGLWNGTRMVALRTLGGKNSAAAAINNAGVAVGSSATASGRTHATLWRGASVTDLGTLGGTTSRAHAINSFGLVAGYASLRGDASGHATLWNGSETIDLGTLGGRYSQAWGLNDAGLAVGASEIRGAPGARATLWDGTAAMDLNMLIDPSVARAGWLLTTAYDINQAGWIVGDAVNRYTGYRHAFMLSPAPEPATVAMLLAGLGLVGAALRRRQSV
jgi:probable HAF family extracellular repeat protein